MTIVTRFILIVSGIVAAMAFGYLLRKKNWLDEKYASPLMSYSVIFGWTPASTAVLWNLPLTWSLLALPLIGMILPFVLAPFGYFFAKFHHLDRKTAGTFIVSAGIANVGFTMGGFVCYCLFGVEGLAYANLFASSWAIPYIGFYYPLARSFGDPNSRLDIKFILRTFFDLRSLPILGTVVGLILNLAKVPMPEFLTTYHIIDILIILSILISFAIVGLQMHLSYLAKQKILHLSLAMAKFVITPLLIVPILLLTEYCLGNLPICARKVVYIEAFMPTALFSVIIANLFELDPRLAGVLFLVNTGIFLGIVLPILALWFG
jgi:predicted permease